MDTASTRRDQMTDLIEQIELNLRYVIDKILTAEFGFNWIECDIDDENKLIKNEVKDRVNIRYAEKPSRYGSKVNALLLEDVVYIISKPELWKKYFHQIFGLEWLNNNAFKHDFTPFIVGRNINFHSNVVSDKELKIAEYLSEKIKEGVKNYLKQNPDSKWPASHIIKLQDLTHGEIYFRPINNWRSQRAISDKTLMVGDTIKIQATVSGANGDDSDYTLEWIVGRFGNLVSINEEVIEYVLTDKDVDIKFIVACKITDNNNSWHRMTKFDDLYGIAYEIIPRRE